MGKLGRHRVRWLRRIGFIMMGVVIIAGLCYAQDWSLSETARSAGMGNAFIAMDGDVSVLAFNPAGLVFIPRYQMMVTYSKRFAGIDFGGINEGSLLFAPRNEGRFSWGLGMNYFAEDVFERMSLSLSYGGRIMYLGNKHNSLSFALSANMFREGYKPADGVYIPEDGDNPDDPLFSQYGDSKMAFGGDVSLLAKIGSLNLGTRVYNINEPNPSLAGVDAGRYRQKARVGLAYTIKGVITPTFDYLLPISSDVGVQDEGNYYAGLEGWLFHKMIALRGGYNPDNYSIGFSFRKNKGFGLGIDYAFIYPSHKGGTALATHKFSLSMSTQIPPPKRYDLAIERDWVTFEPKIFHPGEMGTITAKIANLEHDAAKNFKISIFFVDSSGKVNIIEQKNIAKLGGNDSMIIVCQWTPTASAFRKIYITVDDNASKAPKKLAGIIDETNEKNNSVIFDLPVFRKPSMDGLDVAQTTLQMSQISFVKEEIPIHPFVYFDDKASDIPNRFIPLLQTIAKRLNDNPDVHISLAGYYDYFTESGKDADKLAQARAKAVKAKLVELGASPSQVDIDTEHNPSDVQAGQKNRRPRKALPLVAAENRRVKLNAVVAVKSPVIVDFDLSGKTDLSAADKKRIADAADKSHALLSDNPYISIGIEHQSIGEPGATAFQRVNECEKTLGDKLGWSMKDRIFADFSRSKDNKEHLMLFYSAEPLVYAPRARSSTPEGVSLSEHPNVISLKGVKVDAPLDTFFLVVKDNDNQLFRFLAGGNKDIPDSVSWDWRGNAGDPPNPNRTYYVEFYIRDKVGQELDIKSDNISIKAEKMEHREEMILVNFNFGGTSSQSPYLESRMENLARQIIKKANEPKKKLQILIGGHTDIIGSDQANTILSERRAKKEYDKLRIYLMNILNLPSQKALDDWLVNHKTSITYKGFGPKEPYTVQVWDKGYFRSVLMGKNEFPEGRIMNRRVSAEIKLTM